MNKDGSIAPEKTQEMLAANDELTQFVQRQMAGKDFNNPLHHAEQIWRLLHQQSRVIAELQQRVKALDKANEEQISIDSKIHVRLYNLEHPNTTE